MHQRNAQIDLDSLLMPCPRTQPEKNGLKTPILLFHLFDSAWVVFESEHKALDIVR